jgi:hypothetical protein
MQPKTSRNISGPAPRKDQARETEEAVVQDADKTEQTDRNRIHGDGKTIGVKPA